MTRIALTFDDGPSVWTESILDTLGRYRVPATFFVVGSVARNGQHLLERMAREGHEIGNHSWSHPWLARDCDDEQVREELELTNLELETLVGIRPRLFRAPRYNVDERVERVAADLGLTHVRGDVRPPDWRRQQLSSGVIATLVLQQAAANMIVGLHDGIPPRRTNDGESRRATADAVAIMVPRLLDRGFECVAASTLVVGMTDTAAPAAG